MIESIRTYKFDFAKEVAEVKRRLGAVGDEILFVEARVTSSKRFGIVGAQRGKTEFLNDIGNTPDWEAVFADIESHYRKDPELGSYKYQVKWRGRTSKYLCFVENDLFVEQFGEENKQLMRLFEVYHEMAHFMIKDGPNIDNDHPYREAAADALAAIMMMQRFGKKIIPLLTLISGFRAYETVEFSTKHLSTTVLDKIILDSAPENYFRGLSEEETVKCAHDYAEELTPDAKTVSAAGKIFRQACDTSKSIAENLSKISLSTLEEVPRYIFIKATEFISLPAMQSVLRGKPFDGEDKKLFEKVWSAVEAQIPTVNLRKIFNLEADEAAPSPEKALEITPPPGQARFIPKP